MEQRNPSKHAFVRHTLEMVRAMPARGDATSLVNCLVGLLVVPPDSSFDSIPDEPLADLQGWGIDGHSIRGLATCPCGHAHPRTLRQFVRMLRGAAAHFEIQPLHTNETCTGVEFFNGDFHAVVDRKQLRELTERLGEHMLDRPTKEPASGKTNYVASEQRDPFHRRNCKWVGRISSTNLRRVRSRHAAMRAGHRPCKVCKP